MFGSSIFDYIEHTPVNPRTGQREITDTLTEVAKDKVLMCEVLVGDYKNINTKEDLDG